jgi:hypothetical protein
VCPAAKIMNARIAADMLGNLTASMAVCAALNRSI